jgi:hypothetical protein
VCWMVGQEGDLEYIVTERMDRHMFVTVDMPYSTDGTPKL